MKVNRPSGQMAFAASDYVTMPMGNFVVDERRAWMRLRDHVVVFERDPDFARFLLDPSGSVLRILRIWVTGAGSDSPANLHYVGSIRRCECGGWMSHRELLRLFRRARFSAQRIGVRADTFRLHLSGFLRDYFER